MLRRQGLDSTTVKRQILVVDDELVNRELLGGVLHDEYKVFYAVNGREGLELIRQYRDTLSLVLLDLKMPILSGAELLRIVKQDPETAGIPVIVLTADQSAEIESLELGAVDFIPKPYPQPGVIRARIRRIIELREDRETIRSTERDPLTGLYNREYFFRYAGQLDEYYPERDMDAIVIDIFRFRMINERFGSPYGDSVLRTVGERIREAVAERGGIVCRREADIFQVYCPHCEDYEQLLGSISGLEDKDGGEEKKVRLRMGVYAGVDKGLQIERRFDRAKLAADTVRSSVTRTVGIYDKVLHEKELYEGRLVDDFTRAVQEEQFQVYYQPKFDIRADEPILASAEALVRWKHPELGMISPGVFIPLFEENGLIQQLDSYVWNHAAAQIRDWKNRLGHSVPISVNVSRIDMYDPRLAEIFRDILDRYSLSPDDLFLEITESAYTADSSHIIESVNRLRAMGFQVEMDDFGAGYSSLNMVSSLPIDALKLDMQVIRSAFREQGNTWMLKIMIEIGDHLGVPVIAEGVETQEQMAELKALGCDIIQGYYFSRPVSAAEYEKFLRPEQKES